MTGRHAVAGIQARTGSTRLPGKVLADLAGLPLLARLLDRARSVPGLDDAVVLTSSEPADDAVADLCRREGAACLRGSLTDVLSRYLALLEERRPRYLVRVTGDSPLLCPEFVALQLEALERFDGDVVELAGEPADGTLGGQGALSARALRRAARSDDPRDREHAGSFWLARHRSQLRAVALEVPAAWRRAGTKLSVDEPADLELVRSIFEHFAPRFGSRAPLELILRWLDERPEVAGLNGRVRESAANQAVRALRAGAKAEVVGRWP